MKDWESALVATLAGIFGAIAVGGIVYFLSEKNRIEHPELSNEEYIIYLYSSLLHRDPDPTGFRYYVSQLKAGRPRRAIYEEFIHSKEFKNTWVLQ